MSEAECLGIATADSHRKRHSAERASREKEENPFPVVCLKILAGRETHSTPKNTERG